MLINRFRFPTCEQEYSTIANAFQAKTGFPGIVGAIDGSYIPLGYVPHEDYVNRKKTASVILQAVCDDKMIFTSIYSGWPGRVHDSRVFRRSHLASAVLPNLPQEYHIVGDAAYPLSKSLLTPYKGRDLPNDKEHYNHLLSKNRITIERSFALLKCRWRKLTCVNIEVANIPSLITACCVLHNICLMKSDFVNYDLPRPEPVYNIQEPDNRQGVTKRDEITAHLMLLAED